MKLAVVFVIVVVTSAAQRCQPDQVTASSHCCDGAMGSLHAQVAIRNHSRVACILEGIPRVTLFDETGQVLPAAVEGSTDLDKYGAGVSRFELRPGARAAFTVVTEEPNYDENRCARRMRIDIHGVVIEVKALACGPPGRPLRVFLSGWRPAIR